MAKIPTRWVLTALVAVPLVLVASACDDFDADPTAIPEAEPSFSFTPFPGDGVVEEEQFEVCKVGGPADGSVFNIDVKDAVDPNVQRDNYDVTIKDGECVVVWFEGGADEIVTVTEMVPPGFDDPTWEKQECVAPLGSFTPCVDPAVITTTTGVGPQVSGPAGGEGANDLTEGTLVTFTNQPGEIKGRMTGGGGQIRVDGVRITRGFTIHCDILLSNNLEINWAGGNKWHLDKPITKALCIDDPNVNPEPPPAPFDTFVGEGEGKLNGVSGSIVKFTFVDAGEPGSNDMADIRIWAPGADPMVDTPVLAVSGFLDNGNAQAHFDQPHK